MYKFEILADSMQELEVKKKEAAQFWLSDSSNEKSNATSHASKQDIVLPFPTPNAPVSINTSCVDEDDEVVETASVQAFPTNSSTEVDSRGIPWDARIHAATKKKTSDGSWRTRRNVDEKLVNQVEQELIAKIKAGQVLQSPAVPVPFPTMAGGGVQLPSSNNIVPPPPAPTVPVEMPTFTPPPVTAAPVTAAPVQDYQNVQVPTGNVRPAYTLPAFKDHLTTLLAQLIDQGKIDQPYIQSLKEYFKVKEIWNILANEAQCIELWEMFGQVGFITVMRHQ